MSGAVKSEDFSRQSNATMEISAALLVELPSLQASPDEPPENPVDEVIGRLRRAPGFMEVFDEAFDEGFAPGFFLFPMGIS